MINLNNLVYPYFVKSGLNKKEKIKNFPGILRFSVDRLMHDISELRELGVKKILLFGVPEAKDNLGKAAYGKDNIVSIAIRQIKQEFKDTIVMADVCLCAYTLHGHCGILDSRRNIDNKKTLVALSEIALSYAQAGADWVAPSAMAKKQVGAIRKVLDKRGFTKTKILGYSAKFSSNFYGPFRNASDSAPKFADRRAYQLDYKQSSVAIKEIKADIQEGAEMVMVKPALSYLDVIKEASIKFKHPLAAYNVSGEYAGVKLGAKLGLWDERRAVDEIISSIKRAGADYIITYHAKDIARWQRES